MSSKVYRILSFDGGGMKGLFSAYFMKQFCQDAAIPGNKIYEYFDIIAGSSIGGI
jgi:patatin-like phospholipase/acyl hydrolase